MKRPKTSKIVVYPIVEDTIHGLLWVHNRFLCAPSCPIAYTRVYARAHITQHTMHDWSCYASCDGFLICAAEDTMIDDCAPGSTRRIRVATT